MRKIIQITTTSPAIDPNGNGTSAHREPIVFSLCNDGSVWAARVETWNNAEPEYGEWVRLPEIPQD